MPGKTKDQLVHEKLLEIAVKLKPHFTTAQVTALYQAMRLVIELVSLEETDHRLLEGDDEAEVLGY